MPSNEELTELAAAVASHGDRQAFAVLFKHFAPRLKAFLMREGTAAEVAEELAQETMVAVWRRASTFDPERARLSTWVFTIARNLRIDHYRAHRQGFAEADAGLDGDEAGQLVDPAAPLEEQLGAARRELGVRHALARLSQEQALIVRLSFFEEQPHSRIARELGIPLGTVKSRVRLAIGRLRALLEGFEP
jgi:RNA polymerase sigma factor (sigma-70 family)